MKDLSKWMEQLEDSISINNINLPGTHDSAAISSLPYIHTPYACQDYSIEDQLKYGIRVLDIRLKVLLKDNGSQFEFKTCHGDIGWNEYETLESVMNKCKEFLTNNPSEFIIMSLKIDDNSKKYNYNKIFNQLKNFLNNYPIVTTNDTAIPYLGTVRGKIFILNRESPELRLGTSIKWTDNTMGSKADCNLDVYVQDKYNNLNPWNAHAEKFDLVCEAFKKNDDSNIVLNFASAFFVVWGIDINPYLLDYFGKYSANKRHLKFGWCLFDYAFANHITSGMHNLNIVEIFISTNFSYSEYDYTFHVIWRDQL